MLPPDIVELAERIPFRDRHQARARLAELAEDGTELLALAQLAPRLGESLECCADPDDGLSQLARFAQARGWRLALWHLFQDHPAGLEALVRVIAASRYLADVLVRNPEFLDLVSDSDLVRRRRGRDELAFELEQTCLPFESAAGKLDAVRRLRRREILRIGAADLLGLADLRQTTEQLSLLAEAVIRQCLAIVAGGRQQDELAVLALGKLGGCELNYSSDIDLVFVAIDEERLPSATKLARELTAALGNATGEGFLYRVDLRLRPYGASGALVVSAEMFRDYLASQAHPAERQAMLKARLVAGDEAEGSGLLDSIWPLLAADAAAARSRVRELKRRIERQLARGGQNERHVKLSPGGIRDVEFVVQALQLEAAAERPDLAVGNTLGALDALAQAGVIAGDDADELREAYVFHRLLEHRLQLMDNRQVHRLPDDWAELRRVARSLAFAGPDEGLRLKEAYESRSRRVRAIFERVLDAAAIRASVSAGPALETSLENQERRRESLLAQIREPADVVLHSQRESHTQWTVTIAAHDRLGLLSLVAGLFAAHRIDIASGDVATLAPAADRRPKRPTRRRHPPSARAAPKVLDVFAVRTSHWVEREFWQGFQRELAELVALLANGNADAAREKVIEQVSGALRGGAEGQPLYPVEVEVDNDASPDCTVLHIRSADTVGFLFEFTSALAALDVNIRRVEIRTVRHEVRDTFWVTGAGGRKIVDPDRLHELRVAAALIKQFTHLLPQSPDPAQALSQFGALARQWLSRADWVDELTSLQSESVLRTLAELMGVSQFLWEDFLRMQHESLFPVLRDAPQLETAKSPEDLARELGSHLEASPSLDDRVARLNAFKDREMFRIDLRHITRRIDLEQFSRELSDLAEVVVTSVCQLCHERLRPTYGVPRRTDGRECGWCVCALGKFGGRELGFASDIELVFVYQEEGQTSGPAVIPNSRYFEEFVSQFLRALSARREGVFEIDLRLRPYGKAGALACSLPGFRGYFSPGGPAHQFERLALVKLRPLAGDADLGREILQVRDAFVYSPLPLDYDNIRHLRDRQAAELVPERQISAKHSFGGLVDLEYFVQARQIEAGRDDPRVRVPGTLEAIDRLRQVGALPEATARELADAYRFLRQLIDALRVVRGHAKDLAIPAAGSRAFGHLARRLGYETTEELEREIDRRMAFAAKVWDLRTSSDS